MPGINQGRKTIDPGRIDRPQDKNAHNLRNPVHGHVAEHRVWKPGRNRKQAKHDEETGCAQAVFIGEQAGLGTEHGQADKRTCQQQCGIDEVRAPETRVVRAVCPGRFAHSFRKVCPI